MAVTILPDGTGASATVAMTVRAGRLHHISLPQTLDMGTDHGQFYVVNRWIDGATLPDLLSTGPLEPEVAISITAEVSEAVADAHRSGIALGAITPGLIRVNIDGQVRFSHVVAHGTATPDQDIRAVGALLYLMLTGTWPLPEPPPLGPGRARHRATIPPAPTTPRPRTPRRRDQPRGARRPCPRWPNEPCTRTNPTASTPSARSPRCCANRKPSVTSRRRRPRRSNVRIDRRRPHG